VHPKPSEFVERHRVRYGKMGSDAGYGNNGAFIITSPYRSTLFIVASDELGWEHVSVSINRQKRCPTWQEMHWVKTLFWRDDECVVQYHPPEADYVNCHPYTLHLWRPVDVEMPRPPYILVGPKTRATA
jgi:hypothetical protein